MMPQQRPRHFKCLNGAEVTPPFDHIAHQLVALATTRGGVGRSLECLADLNIVLALD